MARQITYSIHTETGSYNNTFVWGNIGDYLNFLGRYWDIVFVRSNNGRIKFTQSGSNPNPGWAAWTNRSTFTTRISPVFNFKQNSYVCARVTIHEFMHMASSLDHLPGTVPIMCPTGGTCENITSADYQYMSAYPWVGTLRPHHRPSDLKAAFGVPPVKAMFGEADEPQLQFGCSVEKAWYHRWIPSAFLTP